MPCPGALRCCGRSQTPPLSLVPRSPVPPPSHTNGDTSPERLATRFQVSPGQPPHTPAPHPGLVAAAGVTLPSPGHAAGAEREPGCPEDPRPQPGIPRPPTQQCQVRLRPAVCGAGGWAGVWGRSGTPLMSPFSPQLGTPGAGVHLSRPLPGEEGAGGLQGARQRYWGGFCAPKPFEPPNHPPLNPKIIPISSPKPPRFEPSNHSLLQGQTIPLEPQTTSF